MPILTGNLILSRARRYTDDISEPYLVDDTEMYIWITEAERALARAGKLIRDVIQYSVTAYASTSETGSRWIDIGKAPEIIEVKLATLITSGGARYPLGIYGQNDFSPVIDSEDDYGIVSIVDQLTPGRPQSIYFGRKSGYFEVLPVPNVAYTIELDAITYPQNPIESAFDEPTIDERFHQYIPIGAAVMALEGTDDEQLQDRARELDRAWNAALLKTEAEGAVMHRDMTPVKFSNCLW